MLIAPHGLCLCATKNRAGGGSEYEPDDDLLLGGHEIRNGV